jgi:hypothetical protein
MHEITWKDLGLAFLLMLLGLVLVFLIIAIGMR